MTSDLFGLSFISYFTASVLYLINQHLKKNYLSAYGTVATAAGFTFQSVRLVMLLHQTGSLFANANEAMFFLSWAIALLYIVILIWFKLPVVGSLAVPLSMIALTLAYRFSSMGAEKPIASGHWLNAHIVAIILSMAAFLVASCCAVFYLVQNRLLKAKKLKGMFRRLPPLETIDRIAYDLAAIGLALLTLGIITGIVGVESSITERVQPIKIAVSVLTWVIYVAYIAARSAMGWRGKKANWILIAGAALLIVAVGIHKFAWL